jgi:hypothetical protein
MAADPRAPSAYQHLQHFHDPLTLVVQNACGSIGIPISRQCALVLCVAPMQP